MLNFIGVTWKGGGGGSYMVNMQGFWRKWLCTIWWYNPNTSVVRLSIITRNISHNKNKSNQGSIQVPPEYKCTVTSITSGSLMNHVPLKCWHQFTKLNDVTLRKTILIQTAVITSNLTCLDCPYCTRLLSPRATIMAYCHPMLSVNVRSMLVEII
jgi:hypothetical protein